MIAPGTIAVVHRGSVDIDLWRLAGELRHVPITVLPPVAPVHVEGSSIAWQRNIATGGMKGDWIVFLDSDLSIETRDLLLLIRTAYEEDHPLLGAPIAMRGFPFASNVFKSLAPRQVYSAKDLPKEGVIEAAAVGTACLFIRRYVFEAMPPPWFRCGQYEADKMDEDVWFCETAGKAGFPTRVLCDIRPMHVLNRVKAYLGKDGQVWIQWPGVEDIRSALPIDVED